MKKVLFVLSVLMFTGAMVQAQSSCCSKEKAKMCEVNKASQTNAASASLEADKAAAANENIQRRECSVSGVVSYFQKTVLEGSKKIVWEEVTYDNSSGQFTRVASASLEKDPETGKVKVKECCSDAEKAKCAAKCKATGSKKTKV